jgi:hypothetical protein
LVNPQIPGSGVDLVLSDAARLDKLESDGLQTALVTASLLLQLIRTCVCFLNRWLSLLYRDMLVTSY